MASLSEKWILKGHAFLSDEGFGEAIDAFRKALEIEPTKISGLVGLGDAYFGTGDYTNAEHCYRSAIQLEPFNPDGLFGLAATLRLLESYEESIEIYQEGFRRDSNRTEEYWEMAYSKEMTGDLKGAELDYRQCLENHPNHGMAEHLLASLIGENTSRAPKEYVADLFDDYAESFEEALVQDLNYLVPQIMLDALLENFVSSNSKSTQRFKDGLDLGCGTGLVGKALKPIVTNIDGVDLSSKMVNIAEKSGVYRTAVVNDVEDFIYDLKGDLEFYDIIVSGDSLVYIGDLEGVFIGVHDRLRSKGVFCFTLENLRHGTFKLLRTGRYAHSEKFICGLAKQVGFKLVLCRNIIPRTEDSFEIDGRLYVFSK